MQAERENLRHPMPGLSNSQFFIGFNRILTYIDY